MFLNGFFFFNVFKCLLDVVSFELLFAFSSRRKENTHNKIHVIENHIFNNCIYLKKKSSFLLADPFGFNNFLSSQSQITYLCKHKFN